MLRYSFLLLALATVIFGQTFELKDRHGIPVITIDNVTVFKHWEFQQEDLPYFAATVRNVSGENFSAMVFTATVRKKDGTTFDFKVNGPLKKDSTSKVILDWCHPRQIVPNCSGPSCWYWETRVPFT